VFDEEQHLFQVELSVIDLAHGTLAPRPSRRAVTDEDSRVASVIFRDIKEHVVGHTCSARAEVGSDGEPRRLVTEWIPLVEVLGVSDRGDTVFDKLRDDPSHRVLDARWLAEAPADQLVKGLQQLVLAYRDWIEAERKRVTQLPSALRTQATKHLDLC